MSGGISALPGGTGVAIGLRVDGHTAEPARSLRAALPASEHRCIDAVRARRRSETTACAAVATKVQDLFPRSAAATATAGHDKSIGEQRAEAHIRCAATTPARTAEAGVTVACAVSAPVESAAAAIAPETGIAALAADVDRQFVAWRDVDRRHDTAAESANSRVSETDGIPVAPCAPRASIVTFVTPSGTRNVCGPFTKV